MSHFSTIRRQYVNVEAIKKALEKIGLIFEENVIGTIEDYDGRKKFDVNSAVLVRAAQGRRGDLAFVWNEENSEYEMVCDDWEMSAYLRRQGAMPSERNVSFSSWFTAQYAVAAIELEYQDEFTISEFSVASNGDISFELEQAGQSIYM